MEWIEAFPQSRQPTAEEIASFIGGDLWPELNRFLREDYHVEPSHSYSGCSAQPGWNVKYQKSGKSLCTLYPMEGFFIALVVVGNKEMAEAELSMPLCSEYTQEIFRQTAFSAGGKWLMLHVTSPQILEDVKRLIQIRRKMQ